MGPKRYSSSSSFLILHIPQHPQQGWVLVKNKGHLPDPGFPSSAGWTVRPTQVSREKAAANTEYKTITTCLLHQAELLSSYYSGCALGRGAVVQLCSEGAFTPGLSSRHLHPLKPTRTLLNKLPFLLSPCVDTALLPGVPPLPFKGGMT